MVSVNDDIKHMISLNYMGLIPEVLQPYPLKRISSRDSERKTLNGKGADQPSIIAGNSHTREDRCCRYDPLQIKTENLEKV